MNPLENQTIQQKIKQIVWKSSGEQYYFEPNSAWNQGLITYLLTIANNRDSGLETINSIASQTLCVECYRFLMDFLGRPELYQNRLQILNVFLERPWPPFSPN